MSPVKHRTHFDMIAMICLSILKLFLIFSYKLNGNLGAYTEPVQPYMIEPKMTELLAENEARKETMTVVERIARFHLEFEGIHPFIDGNGRCGRLILNLELRRKGYPPINVKFTDRKRYYDAFDAYYLDNDAIKMIDLIAEYIDERLDEYLTMLEK